MAQDDALVGYMAVAPLPGLTNIYEIDGGIIPDKRRQGLGSRLFQQVIIDLRRLTTDPIQLSYCIAEPNSPVAHFLHHHAFFTEHEELLLTMSDGTLAVSDESVAIRHYLWPDAIRHFLALYEQSFSAHAWYQPFSVDEMEMTLDDPHDILFLQDDDTPIGFAWLRLHENGVGEIEPIGVLPAYQGQGNGRCLLIHAIQTLQKRGARQITLGVWANNQPALHLYQSLGFQHTQTLTYLARNL